MYVPNEIEVFFKEYGPLIVDVLLAIPLVRLFRIYLTQFKNRTIAKQNRPSLLQLPDELILEILSAVHPPGCPSSWRNRRKCSGCSISRHELVNVSMTNKRMRNICAPFIFTHVGIGRRSYGWWRASRSLKAAELSFHGKQYATSLTINVSPGYRKFKHPSESFPRRCALALSRYDRVRQLHLVVPYYTAAAFKTGFRKSNLEFPNVRTLILGSRLEWLIHMCPNVEVISTVGPRWLDDDTDGRWSWQLLYNLIQTAGFVPNLRHFEMRADWNTDLVGTVLQCMPEIESLAMPGGQYYDEINALLSILGQFRNLKVLALAEPEKLGVGYDPPGCGNAYFGPGGNAMREQVLQQRRAAVMYVGKMVIEKMRSLNELWVGISDRATFSTNASGRREIEWSDEFRRLPGDID